MKNLTMLVFEHFLILLDNVERTILKRIKKHLFRGKIIPAAVKLPPSGKAFKNRKVKRLSLCAKRPASPFPAIRRRRSAELRGG